MTATRDRVREALEWLESLALIERAAEDERHWVNKGVSWALRVMGRRSRVLNAAAVETSRRLAECDERAARSLGKEALRELTGPVVRRQLTARGKEAGVAVTTRRSTR
jgi:3-methyladenine DNA glycosylase AlkD